MVAAMGWMVMSGLSQSAAQATSGTQAKSAQSAEYDALLAKAKKLYYSYTSEHVAGFDCDVKPDWLKLFSEVNGEQNQKADDPRIVLLNSVKIKIHSHTDASATMDWIEPPNMNDPNGVSNAMHSAVSQTLTGFVQFWTPFMDGDIIPDTSSGLEVHKTADGYTLHAEDAETKVDETLDAALTLRKYEVTMNSSQVKFQPEFEQTDKGLVVNYFLAHIIPVDKTQQGQELHVAVRYQDVQGVEVPREIRMEVVGTGKLNVTLSGCTVTKK